MLSIVRQVSNPPQSPPPLDDLVADLLRLYEDGEAGKEERSVMGAQEELQLSSQVTVRTRYRTKDRRNRCNEPELARKEERRGWSAL